MGQGFHSFLANSRITFVILEGAMIVLATGLLTALHLGFVIGRVTWAVVDWNAGRTKGEQRLAKVVEKSRRAVINEKVSEYAN